MTGGERARATRVSAVIPTVGKSPYLVDCLEALRREGDALRERGTGAPTLEVIVVDQGETPVTLADGLAHRVLRLQRNLGFAAGTNAGIAVSTGDLIATVNDDVMVEAGWLTALVEALEEHSDVAAVQGVNLMHDRPERADGWGLGWNRWWQAVQLGTGKEPPAATTEMVELFGVSATAAVYRRNGLEAVARQGAIFDPRLLSYYEDADLAGRLRAAHYRALLVPRARARHAGSTTGRSRSRERWKLIYGNRYLVAAELLGGAFWARLPRMWVRDLRDLLRALFERDGALISGIVTGWGRAFRRLSAFAHRGGPTVAVGTIERFR